MVDGCGLRGCELLDEDVSESELIPDVPDVDL